MKHYLAMDFGASSGRGILGSYDGEQLVLKEIHRFENGPHKGADGHLHWDAAQLFAEIVASIKRVTEGGVALDGIGIDTWGVDYGLIDANGELMAPPYHYRDARTDTMMDEVFARVPRAEVFEQTGLQFMSLNTLFQLADEIKRPALKQAKTLLFMPDLFNYLLTGQARCERSIASTSQCYNPRTRDWAHPLLQALGLDTIPWAPFIESGTVLGTLTPALAEETGAGPVPVLSITGHDTASAVAAVPAASQHWAYLSSGTWSLMGLELQEPLITDMSLKYNFTNEIGHNNTVRFLKNIAGLWLLQECRRAWKEHGEALHWDALDAEAEAAEPFRTVLDPDDPAFLNPGDMPARIQAWCREQGQPVPETQGQFVRAILEGLALRYRWVIERLEEMSGRPIEVLHIVGGGSRNKLLNRFTASATGKLVLAGPGEATATGNILVQMLGLGHLEDLAQARALCASSFPTERYTPQQPEHWARAAQRFAHLFD